MKAVRTRKYILEKAAPVLNKRGYAGTSLADLSAATGLTKGALYGNFRNKEALAIAAFGHSVAAIRALIQLELEDASTYHQKLCRLLDFFSRYVFSPPVAGGCPLLNTAVEADDHWTGIRRHVSAAMVDLVSFIEQLIRRGMACGEFKKDVRPRELAMLFFCEIEGAIMFARVARSCEPMDIVIEDCKHKLDQITIPWN